MSDEIERLLRFDPLDTAEKLTGTRSADKDSPAMGLGFMLMQAHGQQKRVALEAQDDTLFANMLDRYLRIIGDMGFEEVLRLPFVGQDYGNEPAPQETYFIFARRDGLLLKFDTYCGNRVNGAEVLYNWKGNDPESSWSFMSSGGWTDDPAGGASIIYGYHDAREALRHKIGRLEANGRFMTPWVKAPFMWLLHYMDSKAEGYDYQAITRERIAMLPQWVQEMIGEVK